MPSTSAFSRYRRLDTSPILRDTEIGAPTLRTIKPDDLVAIGVDESYQRAQVDKMVDEIANAIRQGGIIPDPISLAQRKDGTLWVVDGQQRWWACLQEEKACPALVFPVASHEAERRLFGILNNRVNLSGATVVKAWDGPAKDALTWLDSDTKSAVRARLGWSQGSKSMFSVGVILSGLLGLTVNYAHSGSIRDRLSRLDAELRRSKNWCMAAIGMYARLLQELFPNQNAVKLRMPIALGIGRVCHARWHGLYDRDTKNWPFPAPEQLTKLRAVDWLMVVPHVGHVGVAETMAVIDRLWPTKLK